LKIKKLINGWQYNYPISRFEGVRIELPKIKDLLAVRQKKTDYLVEDMPEVSPFEGASVEQAQQAIKAPDHIKHTISHSGHMRVVAKNDDEAAKIGKETLKSARERKSVMYGDDNISGYLFDSGLMKFMTVTKNGNVLSSYPLFNVGKPVQGRITSVTEFGNAYEGQLEAYINGFTLSFFDTMYFKNKNKYFAGKDVKILLSGVAYVLSKAKRHEPVEKKKEQKSPKHKILGEAEFAVRYENGDIDDYVFRGIVKSVKEFEVMGKKAKAIKTSLQMGAEGQHFDFYMVATENAIQEKIRPGDHISGIVWLQGFIVSS
jgi:hypothetical protein